ncbi:hypothetical protein FKG94_12835 [Exilibacterium tricleocarpae]|uniref:Transposase n=1 Tax=Exilibacterium tricleocarpae TaxID=2591008 RepID=A0A545TNV7_9GAMM|nr:transposase [Exilibacterium tricleocarpae]TQV78896.1 hypothetical protein FKG94_12835 [Exilibacterium tricleocarpae]
MARPLRVEYQGAYYHVMNRGQDRKQVFDGDKYYQAFLQGLAEAHRRFGMEILAYCLMSNHYHLLVHTPRGNLSRAMRHVNGVYTQRYNRLKQKDGPLFRGRYKSILVDASAYLLQVSRYIHRNPLEVRNPLVDNLLSYPWSSYSTYVTNSTCPQWLYREPIYGEIGGTPPGQAYREYVEEGTDREIPESHGKPGFSVILGSKAFREEACAKVVSWREVSRKGLAEPVSIVAVVDAVSAYYRCEKTSIIIGRRGPRANIPRWIAMKLCQDLCGQTLSEIGKEFGVGSYSTVSQTIARLKTLMKKDRKIVADLNTISQDLTPTSSDDYHRRNRRYCRRIQFRCLGQAAREEPS